eukprot:m.237221 g.237221  ORF g.237221 m.237221 type:complete len:307 (+) comp21005_c0_seq1:683-1603(+)
MGNKAAGGIGVVDHAEQSKGIFNPESEQAQGRGAGGQRCAQAHVRGDVCKAGRRGGKRLDAREGLTHQSGAAVVSLCKRVSDNFKESTRRDRWLQALVVAEGGTGGQCGINFKRIIKAKKRSKLSRIGAAEHDDGGSGRHAVLRTHRAQNGYVVDKGLLNGEKHHVLTGVGIDWPKRQRLPIEAVLGEQQQGTFFLTKLKHESIVIVPCHDIRLATRAKKDWARAIVELVVDQVALLEGGVCLRIGVIQRLIKPANLWRWRSDSQATQSHGKNKKNRQGSHHSFQWEPCCSVPKTKLKLRTSLSGS